MLAADPGNTGNTGHSADGGEAAHRAINGLAHGMAVQHGC